MLGGVRRQEGSRADLFDPAVCSSRFLSFWERRRAPQELNSSRQWAEGGVEVGDGDDELGEVGEGLCTETCGKITSTGGKCKDSKLAFGKMSILISLASVGMAQPWRTKSIRKTNGDQLQRKAIFVNY